MDLFIMSILKCCDDGQPPLLAAFATAGIEAFKATRRERNNSGDRDNNQARIKCLRKNLRKIVEGLLAGVSEQDTKTQQQAGQIGRSLFEATESFILAIIVAPQGQLLAAVGGSDAEGTEFRKYLGKSAEAFRAAFLCGDEEIV
jgi:hypothetical protein